MNRFADGLNSFYTQYNGAWASHSIFSLTIRYLNLIFNFHPSCMNDAILPLEAGSLEPELVMVEACVEFDLPAIMKMGSL